MSEMVEEIVYMIAPEEIKSELQSDDEKDVTCRLCNKVFANWLALQNHARVAHMEAYETGDPRSWTEDEVSLINKPIKRRPAKVKSRTQEILSLIQPTDIAGLASENVSYIIIKNDELQKEKERSRKRPKKEKDEMKAKKSEPVKEPEAITGPFECLEASSIGSDGTCHQMFFSCCEYSEHLLTEHTRPRRRAARCQVCERPLSQLHQTAPKDYTCEICSEGFDTGNELVEHKNIFHSRKKRYECSVCQKKFFAQGGVVQHMRMHTGDRPYSCTFCPKTFTQKSGLEQHIRTHTKVKPYRCVICSKTFIQTTHLKQHMRTHTNVVPFQCVICEKRFKQSSHLNYHLKHHPADMTDEQKEKYREIVNKIRRDEMCSADEETAQAERSIQGDETETDNYEVYGYEDSRRVITCTVAQYEN